MDKQYQGVFCAVRRTAAMLSNFGRKSASRLMVLIVTLSASFFLFQLSKCGFDLIVENKSERIIADPQNNHNYLEKRSFEKIRRLPLNSQQDWVDADGVQVSVSKPWHRRVENDEKEKKMEKTFKRSYVQALERKHLENRKEIERLLIEVRSLKEQLAGCNVSLTSSPSFSLRNLSPDGIDRCAVHVQRMLDSAEIGNGVRLNNEYEVIPFNYFTLNRMHPADVNLGKRVVEKLVGYKRRDLTEAVRKALETLNSGIKTSSSRPPRAKWRGSKTNETKETYDLDDFVEGLYRIDPATGNQYEMYFKSSKIHSSGHFRVTVVRPFAPIRTLSVVPVPAAKEKEIIHVILPLSGHIESFRNFMEKFAKIGLRNDKRVRLTVVYFGEEGLSDARAIMSKIVQQRGTGNSLKLLALNETFSRAKGIKVGAERVGNDAPGDVLLFVCDVEIVFSGRFLDRCRRNAKPGKQVYYPIVFGLYNPHVVYTLQGKEIPPETERLIVSRDTGYWWDFDYGMSCQYKSDLMKFKEFDEDVVDRRANDLILYRKYVRSEIKVIRATDPGIFHLWHPKVCTSFVEKRKMDLDQYRACIRSRALNEASHSQLGFLAFKEEISKNLPNFNRLEEKKKNFEKRSKH